MPTPTCWSTGDRPRFEDERRDTLLNPIALFEVLSPSTESYDRGVKFARYRGIPSLQHFVLLAQDSPRIEHYRREGETWVLEEVTGLAGRLALGAVHVEIGVAAIYEGVGS